MGRYIKVNGEIRRVIRVEGEEIQVDVAWETEGTFELYTFGGVVPLNFSTAFCDRTGLDYAGLARLLKQNLSASEVKNDVAGRFFINAYAKPPMQLLDSWGNKKKFGTAPSIIENIPSGPVNMIGSVTGPARLDRMSRFCGTLREEKQLDDTFLRRFAELGKLARRLEIEVADAIPFGGTFRIWGRGDGVSPADPFDRTFNASAFDAGPGQAGVFDPDCPLAWTATPLPASGAKGNLVAVTDKTATLADDAWTEPNAYKHQFLQVKSADKATRSPVIEAYNPETREVTFAQDWKGSAGSAYVVVNGRVVESRRHPTNDNWMIFLIEGSGWQGHPDLEGFLLTILDDEPTACAGIVRQVSFYGPTIEVVVATTRKPTDDASYTISIDPTIEGRLAAALQIGKDALHLLLSYAFPPSDRPYERLDVACLTWLWRLARIARAMRVTIAEYILARGLAGLEKKYILDPDTALDDAQRAVGILEFCRSHRFTPYEMDWAIHGGRSPFVKPGFDPNSTFTLLKNLASSAAATLLTPNALMQAGFNLKAAEAAIALLVSDGLVDKGGAVTPPTKRFRDRSHLFPITSASLKKAVPILSEAEAIDALHALSQNRPPALEAVSFVFLLQPAFDPVSSLQGVLTGCENSAEKRAAISAFLEKIADLVLFRPTFYVSALESNCISNGQALVVLDRLVKLGIVAPLQDWPDLWELTSSWDGSTGGWDLFAAHLMPESNKIASFNKKDRWLQLEEAWTNGQPNAVTYLELLDAKGKCVWNGNASAGGPESIRLPADFGEWDELEGGSVHLLPDPHAAEKTAEIGAALDKLADLRSVQQAYKSAVAAQQAAVANAVALALGTTADAIASSLPYVRVGQTQVRDIVPMFLGADAPSNLKVPTALLVDLSRIVLVRSKFTCGDNVWRAMARRPALYGFDKTSPFAYHQMIRIDAFEKLLRDIGASAESLIDFLETWPGVELKELQTKLHYLTGWAIADIAALSRYFLTLDHLPTFDLRNLTNRSYLARPFAIIAKTGAGAASLISLREATRTRLGALGKNPNVDGWAKLAAARDLSLALAAGRYGSKDYDGVADELSRAASARERNALLSFLGWAYKKANDVLTKPSELSEHLLIDLEVSDCDTTGPVANPYLVRGWSWIRLDFTLC